MAKATNALTMGISGSIPGLGLTFRRRRGGDVSIGSTPKASSKPPTAAQQATRENFREAAAAGREAIKDPATKAYYEQFVDENVTSAYSVAMQDRLGAPTIKAVSFEAYHGSIGDTILITAFDNYGITRVSVHIQNPDGSLVEETDAIQKPGTLDWVFTATAKNASLAGDIVTIHAFDRAGNNVTFVKTLG